MRLALVSVTFLVLGLWGVQPVQAQSAAQLPDAQRFPGWVFTPSLGFGGAWDTNVLLVNPGDDPPRDYGSPISPSASLDYTGRRTRFSGGYDGSLVLYRTLDELNSFHQTLRALVEHRLNSRFTIFAQENYTLAPTTDALELAGIPFYRIGSRTNSAGGGFTADVAKHSSIRAAYTLQSVRFDFDERAGHELQGGHSHQLATSFARAVSPRLTVGGEYELQRAVVGGNHALIDSPEDRFSIQTGSLVASYQVAPTLSLSGGFGVARLGAGLTHSARTGPTLRAGITHRWRQRVLSASYQRSFIPSFGFGGTVQNQEWSGNAHVPFARNRAYVNGGLSWFDNEPLEIGQPALRSMWLSGALGYRATPWLRVEGFYHHAQQDTRRAGGQLARHQLGFQIITARPLRLR